MRFFDFDMFETIPFLGPLSTWSSFLVDNDLHMSCAIILYGELI